MRIWLDRDKLAAFGLSAAEVLAAVREQNSQTAGGGLGLQPIDGASEFTAQIITQNRFSTTEQFRRDHHRLNPDGSTVRLGDVARVELGQRQLRLPAARSTATETVGMAVQMASGANALATAAGGARPHDRAAGSFPPDISLGDAVRHHAVHHQRP